MNDQAYRSVTSLSFGEVTTYLVPDPSVQDQRQALDAILVAAHTGLTSWVVDFTLDPESRGGKQEQVRISLMDGSKDIGAITFSVPTTSQFGKAMFQRFVEQTIMPDAMTAYRKYQNIGVGARSGQGSDKHPLTESILPDTIEHVRRVSPRQLVMN